MAAMTYNSLVTELEDFGERSSDDFVAEIPQIINRAENQLAIEAKGLGFIRSITDDLVERASYIGKPQRWRETVSFQIGTGSGFDTRVVLLKRSYEFVREYWPNARLTGTPKYYADWDFKHWLISPTPDIAYPYEILYHERPTPLTQSAQTNWTTMHAPQLLLYACLVESAMYLKRDDRIQAFKAQYMNALQQLELEQQRRLGGDRSRSVDVAG